MSLHLLPNPQAERDMSPAELLGKVDPARQDFAVALADGVKNISAFCREHKIPRTNYHRWRDDPAIQAYLAAVRAGVVGDGQERLRGLVHKAIDALERALTTRTATSANVRAAETILDRVGLSKEAAQPKHTQAAPQVVQVTLNVPVIPDEAAQQAERRRRREQHAIEAGGTTPHPI